MAVKVNYDSDKTHVFPSNYRTVISNGKYTSEENFVNIISSIVDRDSYVLSTSSSLSNNEPLRFVIHGYYFSLEDLKPTNGEDLYAYIRVENVATDSSSKPSGALVNFNNSSSTALDSNNEFTGLALYNSQRSSGKDGKYTIYELKIADKGTLVNQVRLSTNSVYYDNNSDKTLSSTLRDKQDNLSAGYGIDNSQLKTNKTIQLKDTYLTSLNSIENKDIGNAGVPVYIDDGKFYRTTASSGHIQQSGQYGDTQYKVVQAALIEGGDTGHGFLNTGLQVFASGDAPATGVGRNGDIWLKYTTTTN